LQYWSDDPTQELAVAEARLLLGRLLFAEGSYLAARRHLQQFVDTGVGSDELRSMIAESSFKLAEQAAITDPILMAEERQRAVDHFMILLERYRSEQIDGPVEIYRKAAFYLGASYLLDPGSDPVKALVAFLRARQMFPENKLEPELVLAIARCYAQLEEDSHLIEELYHVLSVGEQMNNGEEAVAALMGSLKGDLVAYDDSVRAQVLFYIAQAHYRAAQRRPGAREDHLKKAVRDYRRVLVEAQTPHLSVAARLGLGRAALALGDEQQGIAVLEEVLASDKVHPRDGGLAARWLGDYYLEQEQFEAAASVFARGVDLAQQAGVGAGRGNL
jgi:tetratricopeptide (TPR) repeat protein